MGVAQGGDSACADGRGDLVRTERVPDFSAMSCQTYQRVEGHGRRNWLRLVSPQSKTSAGGRGTDSRARRKLLIIKELLWWRRRESNPIPSFFWASSHSLSRSEHMAKITVAYAECLMRSTRS